MLLKGKQGVHRRSPLAKRLSEWSLFNSEDGFSKQLRACFHLGASPEDEILELLEQKLYWFMVACPEGFRK